MDSLLETYKEETGLCAEVIVFDRDSNYYWDWTDGFKNWLEKRIK